MRSAAMLEALRAGSQIYPVLVLDLAARGLDLGRKLYSTAIRLTDLGQITAVTKTGSWSPIKYGSGVASNDLEAVTASVSVSDKSGELFDALETYDPRGSLARIYWAAPNLVFADWEPLFTGVLADWDSDAPWVKLSMKVDDAVLRVPVPSKTFEQTAWNAAEDGTIFGTAQPIVLGIYDSLKITARGAVPLINIRYDATIGYWYALSSDHMVTVDALYYDGVPQGTAGWSVLRGLYGGGLFTIIVIQPGYQPAADVIVSVDCHGPDELGGFSGDTLTGAPDQLRAIAEEFAFRDPPLRLWRGPHSSIDDESWDAASSKFALHRIESARVLGGDQNAESIAEVFQSFLEAHNWVRIHWNELGKLEFVVIDPDDLDPDAAAWLQLNLYHKDRRVPFVHGDDREVYSHINMPYLYMPADQKYISAVAVHDIGTQGQKVPLEKENPWTQARLDQDLADLNPQPPADPTPP